MVRGLVIGKFYPFHKGHQYLISYAKERVDELWVIICQKTSYEISAVTRAAWIQAVFPGVKILIVPADNLSDDDSKGWANYTLQVLGFTPDIVFTSEDYGDPYAKFMGTKHVLVDRERKNVPISGTQIRLNVFDNLQWLSPIVKAHFVRRIAIVGAESTGTTTLSKDLASAYGTNCVLEYGRIYSEGKNPNENWYPDELIHIAKMQCAMEDTMAQSANKVLICDTDPFATTIWYESLIGGQSQEVEAIARGRKYDLYVLTDINGVSFEQDGFRDDKRRMWMHQRFIEKLTEWKIPFVLAKGKRHERISQVKLLIDELLSKRVINNP